MTALHVTEMARSRFGGAERFCSYTAFRGGQFLFSFIHLSVCPSVRPSDWEQVIGVAVLDCAQEENFDVCKEFGIKFYPTFKVRCLPSGPLSRHLPL